MTIAPEVGAHAERLRERYPRLRLVAKERSLMMRRLAAWTGMRWWNPGFLTGVTTTLWSTVYMPSALLADPVAGLDVLRHEAVHLEQFARHPVWMPVSYLLLLPAGLTMRARWELEAYVESMRAELERTGDVSDATITHITRMFTGPAYLFMDVRRRRVRARLESARRDLRAEI